MEKEEKVKPVRVSLFCDECGEEMVNTGMMLPTHPAQYEYECSNFHKAKSSNVYPFIRWEVEQD